MGNQSTCRTKFDVRLLEIAILALATVMLAGCGAADSKGGSKVKLEFSDLRQYSKPASAKMTDDVGASATTLSYSRIMINVRPDGAAPLVDIWEGNDGYFPVPPAREVEVPKDKTGMVQVLVITREVDPADPKTFHTGRETFFYGQANGVKFSSGIVPVEPVMRAIEAATGGSEGAIAGRYLDANGNGPTSKIAIKFQPDSGAPAMTVTQSEMHGGWFDFIAIEGIKFTYTMEDGTDVFANYLLGDQSFVTAPQNLLVSVPAAYLQRGGGGNRELMKPYKFMLGYFGPGGSGKTMCYDSSTSLGLSNFYTAATGTSTVPWAAGSPSTSAAGVVTGGQAAASANCSTEANLGSTWMKFEHATIRDGHGVLGIKGPFKSFVPSSQNYPTYLSAQVSGANIALEWQYQPGSYNTTAGGSKVDGVGVFVRQQASTNNGRRDYEVDDGIACNQLTTVFNFREVAKVALQNSGAGMQTYNLTGITAGEFYTGGVQIVLCPYSDSRKDYFTSAVTYENRGGGPSFQLKLSRVGTSSNTLTQSACHEMKVEVVDGMGNVVTLPSGNSMTLNVSTRNANDKFNLSSSSACSTDSGSQSNASMALDNVNSSKTFWFKPNTLGFHGMDASPSGNSGSFGAFGGRYDFGVVASTPPTASKLVVKLMSLVPAMVQNQCYEVLYYLGDSGTPSMPTTGIATTGTLTGMTGTYYTGPFCTGGTTTSLSIPAGSHATRLYFKPTGAAPASSQILSVSGITGEAVTVMQMSGISLDSAGVVDHYIVRMEGGQNEFMAGNHCKHARVVAVSANGAPVNVPVGVAAKVNISGAQFYDFSAGGGGCSNGGTTAPVIRTISAGHSMSEVFQFRETANAATFSVNVGILSASNTTIKAMPPFELSWDGSNPNSFIGGVCHPVRLLARANNQTYALPDAFSITGFTTSNGTMYSDVGCQTSMGGSPTISFSANSAMSDVFYLKTAGSSFGFNPTGMSASYFGAYNGFFSGVPPSTNIANISSFSFASNGNSGSCYNFTLTANGLGTMPANMNVDLTSSNGATYLGHGCGTPLGYAMFAKAGSNSVQISVMKVSTGTLDVAAPGGVNDPDRIRSAMPSSSPIGY